MLVTVCAGVCRGDCTDRIVLGMSTVPDLVRSGPGPAETGCFTDEGWRLPQSWTVILNGLPRSKRVESVAWAVAGFIYNNYRYIIYKNKSR